MADEEKQQDPEKATQAEIDAVKAKYAKYNEGNPKDPLTVPDMKFGETTKTDLAEFEAKLPKENNPQQEEEGNGPADPKKRDTIDVDTSQNGDEWINKKRQFWQKYAEENGFSLQNDPQADAQSGTFSAGLSNTNGSLGEIKYVSESNAQISKDASIELYRGLVKDAVANELSVTFGETMDDKQKAMLLAACLMSKDKYADGTAIEMVNKPQIDMNAEYFKELPEDVRKVLKDHLDKQNGGKEQQADGKKPIDPAIQAQIDEKIDELKARYGDLPNHFDEKAVTAIKLDKEATNAELILAKRLGLVSPDTKTTGKEYTKDEEYAARIQKNAPKLYAAVQAKYSQKTNG